MLCCRYYDESLVASFAHQIQSKYYAGNRSMSIDFIVLEHFSTLPNSGINSSIKSLPRHAVFRYFLSDDSKQYAATITSYSKRLIGLFKKQTLLASSLSTIW